MSVAPDDAMTLLDVKNLSVSFDTRSGPFRAVDGLDLHIAPFVPVCTS